MDLLRLSRDSAEKIAEKLNYRHRARTVVAVVQEAGTGTVLMVASMNKEAVVATLTTGLAHYWSLTRRRLWLKGETSGNIQIVEKFYVDCDRDAVLLVVKQVGVACHKGFKTCFHNSVGKDGDLITVS